MIDGNEPPAGTLGPTVAGSWYPADRVALARQLDTFLSAADASADITDPLPPAARVSALIVPHAGYAYSGAVAARGFRRLSRRRYERVILLGPSHHAAIEGAVVPRATVYRTPLGDVDLDTIAGKTLASRQGFSADDGPFRPEHCLEAEIPFLQQCLEPGWRLLPVLVGRLGSPDAERRLAETLRPLVGPRSLVVVSSDFTHYGPNFGFAPFDRDVPQRIEALDMGAARHILDWDAAGFRSYVERTGATICGRNPIRLLIRMMTGPQEGCLAAYDNSGRITGNWDHSVSYASLVFVPRGGDPA